jgi:hypothetical protein
VCLFVFPCIVRDYPHTKCGWDPMNPFISTIGCLFQVMTWISIREFRGRLFVDLWWEVVVSFVDIGRFGDYHCLSFLSYFFLFDPFISNQYHTIAG